jgi:cell division septum initiation protein DivIVA
LTYKQLVKRLLQDFEILKKENSELRLRVTELEYKLAKYENPKNSGNSSVAPSQDPFRKTKSLRVKSNKPQGGQKGHKGSKLRMVASSDAEIVIHDIAQCDRCGHGLPEDACNYDARQVFDIPSITIKVTEHRRLHKTCNVCGKHNKGAFPEGLAQEAQ